MARVGRVWRDDVKKVLHEATRGAAKLPAEVRDSLSEAIEAAKAGDGLRGAREARKEREREAKRTSKQTATEAAELRLRGRGGRGHGGASRGRGRGGRGGGRDGGGDGDDGPVGLVGAEATTFAQLIMENWQIIAEDPLLWEVHLSAGLEGGNFDTLMKNYGRRWKPKLWRAKRFDFCDGLRVALTTDD